MKIPKQVLIVPWVFMATPAYAQGGGIDVSTNCYNPYPANPGNQYTRCSAAQIITGNAAGTTVSVVGTLGAVANHLNYICGFEVSAAGGTAAVGPITVAGLTGSSMVYQLNSAVIPVNLTQTYYPCIPASAANTAITVTTTTDSTATVVDVNLWGYVQ